MRRRERGSAQGLDACKSTKVKKNMLLKTFVRSLNGVYTGEQRRSDSHFRKGRIAKNRVGFLK